MRSYYGNMWVYYDKANGSLLFLLEFNLKVFRENNTTIRVLLTFWTFSGDRQFTVETTIFSNSAQGGRCRDNWKYQNISQSLNCKGHCFNSRATRQRGFDTGIFVTLNIEMTKNIWNILLPIHTIIFHQSSFHSRKGALES